MSPKLYILTACIIGIICGLITTYSFFSHSWAAIFLWVGVGLFTLYFSSTRSSAVIAGALYGFLTIATWLITGFRGTSAQMKGLFAIVIIASSLTGAAGAIGGFIFSALIRKLKSRQAHD